MVGALAGQARPGSGLRLWLLYAAVQATRCGTGDRDRISSGDGPPRAQQEQADPLGVTYQVGDAVALPLLGAFDLVTAILSAQLCDEHGAAARHVPKRLRQPRAPGGRFIAYPVNPAIPSASPTAPSTGATCCRMTPEADRYVCDAEFMTEPPTPLQCSSGARRAHERAITGGGVPDVRLVPVRGVARRRGALRGSVLARFPRQLPVIGLVCQK